MNETTRPIDNNLARALPLIAIAIAATIGAITLDDVLSFEALAANREALLAFRDAYYWATVGVFMLAYVGIVAFSLPGATIATLAGGFLFGTFPGVAFNVMAASLGAVAIFTAARWGLGDWLAARMDGSDGHVKRLKRGMDANQWEMLFLMRLIPVVPFWVANLVPALVGVPLSRFAIATALGIIPGSLVYTSVGAGLGDVIAAGEAPDLAVIFEPQILLPILGLAMLAALPMAARQLRARAK